MHTQVFFHSEDIFSYQPISQYWMIIYIILSFGFFIKLNRIFKSNDMKNNWLKENILLSFIHACISSILIIISVIRTPEMFQDPLSHSNHFNYALIAFSLGYFLYDFFDCIRNSPRPVFGILIHHVIAILFFIHVLYQTRNLGYTIYGLSIEINSIFLHARRLLRWYSPITYSNLLNNSIKIFVEICNYLTFILFRFGIIIIGLRAVYIQQNRLHPIVLYFIVFAGLGIGIINIILFYHLNKNYFHRKLKEKL